MFSVSMFLSRRLLVLILVRVLLHRPVLQITLLRLLQVDVVGCLVVRLQVLLLGVWLERLWPLLLCLFFGLGIRERCSGIRLLLFE
jgi:hypothetical protein